MHEDMTGMTAEASGLDRVNPRYVEISSLAALCGRKSGI